MVQKLVAVVDTQFDNKISIGQVNLGDKVNLELEVTMGGEPLVYENPTFNLIAKKSDGTRVRQTEGITLSGGTVIIDCDEQLSTYKGAVSSQLIIKDGDRVSTCIFYFTVGASLEADIIVNSIDKVNTLDDLDELISAGFENLAIFEAKLSEYEVDLGSIIAEESKRITNENLRVTGEADRKASESERITAESVRSASESARVSSEEERIANEMDRVDNEADRRMAENIRKSNEAKREAAEEERANLFELNEEIRKEQEKQRVLNEKRRVEAFDNLEDREGIRLMAEQNRVTAENEREVAEANRRTAELEREAAEENREATYTAFNEAESERVSSEIARKTAEANRVEAEARRVEAESNRDYLYRTAEENRDASYSTKESNRDSKYAQAEKNRDALFESNEANRKDSYTTAERKRVENENIRQANEVARDKAEVVRANGELAREGKESARVQAESKRVTAEQSRVTAESKRVTDFEKIKSDISTLDSKLTQKVDTKIADLEALNSNFKQDITAQYEDIVTEFDKVIANVTNGNENATNSEIVQARGKEVNLNARLDNFDEQLDTKTNETRTNNIQAQINNLVLGAVGDGNNAEVVQARGEYDVLNDRLIYNEENLTIVYDREVNQFTPINEMPTLLNWSEIGHMCISNGTIVPSEYAGSTRALKLPVKSGHTYKIDKFYGNYYLYDKNGENGGEMLYHQPNTVPYEPLTVNIPKNVGYIGLNLTTSASPIEDFTEFLRITPTKNEMINCKFEMPNLVLNDEQLLFSINNKLKGKTIVNFGDSIFGQARPPYDISTKLAELTGATVYNCGFGGCQMGYHAEQKWDAFSMYRLADSIATGDWSVQDNALALGGQPSYFAETVALLKTIDFSKIDIATISYGTNDFTNGLQPIKAEGNNTFYAVATSLQYSIEKIQTVYPNIRIFICTPTYRVWLGNSNEFIEDSNTATHKPWVYESDGSPSVNHTFLELIQGIKDTAKANQLPIIDNYYLGINKYNRLNYFPENDNVHHNQNGRDLIALNMAHKLY